MAAAPRTKLFVGHLPDGCTNEELQNLFEKYGSVKECDVINKYGFVHMATPEEAEDAIKALNNYTFRGASLSVEKSKSKLHPEPGAPGRAKGGQNFGFGGGPFRGGRGGFGERGGFPPRGGRGGFSNGYNRYDGPSFGNSRGGGGGGGGSFYGGDRYGGGMSPRMRPYPMPYDRPMGPPRDDFYDRPSPYSGAPARDPYARPPTAPIQRDMYERRPTAYPSASDYLYSRRSPPSQMPTSRFSGDYYGNSFGDSASRAPALTRRPYF